MQCLDEVYFGPNKYTERSDVLFKQLLSFKAEDFLITNKKRQITHILEMLDKNYSEFTNKKVIFYIDMDRLHSISAYTMVSELQPDFKMVADKDGLHFTGIRGREPIKIYFAPGIIDMKGTNRLTPREVTAVTLHEIGHNFEKIVPYIGSVNFIKSSLLVATDVAKMAMAGLDELKLNPVISHHMDELKGYFNLSIGRLLKIDSVVNVMKSFIPSIQQLFFLYDLIKTFFTLNDSNFKKAYISERFADSTAAMYGYGKDLAVGLTKLTKAADGDLNPIDDILTTFFFSIYLINVIIVDVHPNTGVRIYQVISYLENELENNYDLPLEVRKDIKRQIDELKPIADEFNKVTTKGFYGRWERSYAFLLTKVFRLELGDIYSTFIIRSKFDYEEINDRILSITKKGKKKKK